MALSVSNDAWLVADSEDDDIYAPRASPTNPSTPLDSEFRLQHAAIDTFPNTLESLSTFANESLFTPPPPRIDSTIGDLTSVPSTSGSPSKAPKPPRPRPRVVSKKAATSDQNSIPPSRISDPPIPTTRRTIGTNDTILSATAVSFGLSDATGDAYSSFGIAERAKMRSRKKPQPKIPIQPPDEVIELTSDEDELALKPKKRQKKQGQANPKPDAPTRPRPKPTLRVRRAAVIPNDSPSNGDVIQHPQAPPAQLPSSSLPSSTLPTIPPSTPPQARELTPLSSPLIVTRKRKRICPSVAEDDDEMVIVGSNPARVSPSVVMPPPFFAPSSSPLPTDSGVDIPPVESVRGRGKKKQATRKKAQPKSKNKGKGGKKAGTTSAVAEMEEVSVGITQEPLPAGPSDRHSPALRNSPATKEAPRKGKGRAIDSGDEEDDPVPPSKSHTARAPNADEGDSKENSRPDSPSPPKRDPPERASHMPTNSGVQVRGPSIKPKSTPMSELIRRANSQPSSPFPNASRTYSPFLKSSRTMLSKIAPLHPNRRTPPPPPPRPPPPKKSKKQLEMEERIEEELAETTEGWSCLTDEERRALRKARIDAELGYD